MERFVVKCLVVLALPVLGGCQKASETPAGAKTAAAASKQEKAFAWDEAIPQGREADDTARFLAGMAGSAGSPFAALEAEPSWQEHHKLLDEAWAKADDKLIRGLHEFQKSQLSDASFERNVLFYPFSGPDALTATLCFPDTPTYILVALEPAGSLPSLHSVEQKKLPEYLGGLRETVASELGKSFFITREMDRQFRGQVTDGLLIPISMLLVRTGHTILGYQYNRLDENAAIVDRPNNAHIEAKYANKGFVIEFRTDADQSVHRLYYYSLNLDDNHMKGNTGFIKYVDSIPKPTTILKATSYMTHHPEFSIIRDLVVKDSAVVLQDDSGIPYKNFSPDQWNVQLYGEYTTPYTPFQYMAQADLRKAYLAGDVKPLPMRLGYGFGKVTSNLLLARRKSGS